MSSEPKHRIRIVNESHNEAEAECKCGWTSDRMDVSRACDEGDEHLIQMARIED